LTGRVLSTSYVPRAGDPGYEVMLADLQKIFAEHEKAGKVAIEYDTRLYYGRRDSLQVD